MGGGAKKGLELGKAGGYKGKEWKNSRHSKSGNKMCVTRREGIVC